MSKHKAVMKIIWVVVNLLLFIAVSIITIQGVLTESKVYAFAALGLAGTGFTCISGLSDIWVEFPGYMRALKGLNSDLKK